MARRSMSWLVLVLVSGIVLACSPPPNERVPDPSGEPHRPYAAPVSATSDPSSSILRFSQCVPLTYLEVRSQDRLTAGGAQLRLWSITASTPVGIAGVALGAPPKGFETIEPFAPIEQGERLTVMGVGDNNAQLTGPLHYAVGGDLIAEHDFAISEAGVPTGEDPSEYCDPTG